jgi:hypothetical protein
VAEISKAAAEKLASLVRLLASDKDGEVLGAARAINRTLKSAGTDIHALADRVELANGKQILEQDMRRIFNAGYEKGLRAAEDKHHGNGDFHNVDGMPSWHEIARWCQRHGDRLRSKEEQFINDMAARTMWREPTEK